MPIDIKAIFDMRVRELVLVDQVVTLSPDSPVSAATALFRSEKIGSVVIVVDGKPVGIFTERDYVLKLAGAGYEETVVPISKFMTHRPQCVTTGDLIGKVLLKMRLGNFRHLVVVNSEGNLENIISIKDVMDFLLDIASEAEAPAA